MQRGSQEARTTEQRALPTNAPRKAVITASVRTQSTLTTKKTRNAAISGNEDERLEQQHEERAIEAGHLALARYAVEVVEVGRRTMQKPVECVRQKRHEQGDLDTDCGKTGIGREELRRCGRLRQGQNPRGDLDTETRSCLAFHRYLLRLRSGRPVPEVKRSVETLTGRVQAPIPARARTGSE